MKPPWYVLGMLGSALVACCSCDTYQPLSEPARVHQHDRYRTRFVLDDEPAGARGVIQLREALDSAEGDRAGGRDERAEVVVVGRIGGSRAAFQHLEADFPWETGRAAFVIVDAAFLPDADGHDHEHEHADGHDCPFCTHNPANAQAIVQFVGVDGQTVPIDARELFGVREDQIVVVRGIARLQAGMLVLNADGLYVRR